VGKGLPPDPKIAERRQRVVTMRNAGASWDRIAEQLGIAVRMAQSDVDYVMKNLIRIPADQMVQRQRAILLDIIRVEYPAAMDPTSPRHYPALEKVLEVLRDERKLFGLDRPTRVELGISEDEFAARAAELLKITGPAPLAELASGAKDEVVDAEVVEAPDSWSNL
jgi:hypothetical protein